MAITRKQFLSAAFGGSAVLLLQACGGGDDYDEPSNQCGAGGTSIKDNHGHGFAIPVADFASTTNKSYNITGEANHPHTVTFTPAQLRDIRDGRQVTVTSTTDGGHNHAVTAYCV